MTSFTLGPPPWSEEMLRSLYFRDFQAAERAIQEHPGFEVSQDLGSLELSLAIFRECISDLFNTIESFHKQAADPRFWARPNRASFDRSALAVTKAVFVAAASALALVDHSRVVRNRCSIPGYDEKRSATFDDVEHQFIQDLRNYVSHYQIVEADWQREYAPSGKWTKFLLRRSSLLRWNGWTELELQFIDRHPIGVDVEALFRTYAQRVEVFQQWFREQIRELFSADLSDYLRYDRMLKGFEVASFWRILLKQVIEKSIDPFLYLDRYLTDEELTQVMALPPRSKQQVDRVIDILGEYDACDAELRELVCRAFGVGSAEERKG